MNIAFSIMANTDTQTLILHAISNFTLFFKMYISKCMCMYVRNSICMSGDGSFLFTAGGSDLTINAWRVDTNAMDAQVEKRSFM
jgi:hypothetical protein